jgi:hypothetical protein
MSSERQIEANRKNAEHAGVKTETGKSITRHNAFKHGLTAKVVLSNLKTISESYETYTQIFQGLRESFNPKNYYEESLVEAMASAQFKLGRYEHVESSLFSDPMPSFDLGLGGEGRPGLEMNQTGAFELALKYKASLEAQLYRAVESLMKYRQCFQLDLFLPDREKSI